MSSPLAQVILSACGQPIDQVRTEIGVEKLICPSLYGSRAGNHSTYSPKTGWWYSTSCEVCAYTKAMPVMAGKEGDMAMGGFIRPVRSTDTKPFIGAFDPLTGKREWTYPTVVPNVSPPFFHVRLRIDIGCSFGDQTNTDVRWLHGEWPRITKRSHPFLLDSIRKEV